MRTANILAGYSGSVQDIPRQNIENRISSLDMSTFYRNVPFRNRLF